MNVARTAVAVVGFVLVLALLMAIVPASAFAANGSLKITSFPSGAEVVVDGISTGKTTPANVSLTEGAHEVTVKAPGSGWQSITRTITIVVGNNDLSVTLLPALTQGGPGPAGQDGRDGTNGTNGVPGVDGPQGPPGPTTVFGLTVDVVGTGTGSVTSSDTEIKCSPDCTEVYPGGTLVTLVAAAAKGSMFTGWSGSCSGTNPCTLTLNATRTTAAQFDLLTVPPIDNLPCDSSDYVEHSNGLGQSFINCDPLNTYTLSNAIAALTAWAGTDFHKTGTCGSGASATQIVYTQNTSFQAAVWAYSGLFAGRVTLNTTTNIPLCPTLSDSFWH